MENWNSYHPKIAISGLDNRIPALVMGEFEPKSLLSSKFFTTFAQIYVLKSPLMIFGRDDRASIQTFGCLCSSLRSIANDIGELKFYSQIPISLSVNLGA